MNRYHISLWLLGFSLILGLNNNMAFASVSKADYQLFRQVFNNWTTAFNNKDLKKTCHLFSSSVSADYRGTPHKNYRTICNGFKQIFAREHEHYVYSYKIHDVYRGCDLAAVRITWYLNVYEDGKLKTLTQDEGIDILKKDKSGDWKIVNYIGYAV